MSSLIVASVAVVYTIYRSEDMNVSIYSRKAINKLLAEGFPANTAVISFYDPINHRYGKGYKPVDYLHKVDRVFQIALHDIDLEILGDYDLTYDTYLPEVDDMAAFIYAAKADGLDIICQCEYGQSRSAACAAAILEHFYKTGITIFTDYRYYPNQLVYNKVYNALEDYQKYRISNPH